MTVIEKEIKFRNNKDTHPFENTKWEDIPILRDKIVCYCMEKFPLLIDTMQTTTHTNHFSGPHHHHHEGSVWTHTLMVMTFIEATNLIPYFITKKQLMIAAFFHDIGKFYAQTVKSKKYTFKGHEGISTVLSVPYLNYMRYDFDLTDEDIEIILSVINFHRYENTLLGEHGRLINMFRYFDSMGAIKYIKDVHNIDPYEYQLRDAVPFTKQVYTYVKTPFISDYLSQILPLYPGNEKPHLLEHSDRYEIDYYENISENVTVLLDPNLPSDFFDDEENVEICKKFLFPTKECGFQNVVIRIL